MSKELQSNVNVFFSHFVEINLQFVEESLFVISANAQPLILVPLGAGESPAPWVSPCSPAEETREGLSYPHIPNYELVST